MVPARCLLTPESNGGVRNRRHLASEPGEGLKAIRLPYNNECCNFCSLYWDGRWMDRVVEAEVIRESSLGPSRYNRNQPSGNQETGFGNNTLRMLPTAEYCTQYETM
jgi:hypothetical protein